MITDMDTVGNRFLRINVLILFLGIISSSFNIIPALVLPVGLAFLVFLASFFGVQAMDARIYKDFRLMFIVFTIYCVVFAGALGVDIFDLRLYRMEFRFIIPFAYLILLSSLYYPDNLEPLIKHILIALAIIGFTLLLAASFYELDVYVEMWRRLGDGLPIYVGLFSSHHGSGGFYAVLALLLLGLFMEERSRRTKVALAVGIVFSATCLVYSTSRSYLIGTAVTAGLAIIIYMVTTLRLKYRFEFLKVSLLVIVFVISAVGIIRVQYMSGEISQGGTDLRARNVAVRFELWERALKQFLSSPIIGIGTSRFDDDPETLKKLPRYASLPDVQEFEHKTRYLEIPFFKVNISSLTFHSYGDPHNVYLRILTEGGVIFFSIFVFMMYKFCKRLWLVFRNTSSEERGLAMGTLYSIFCVGIASFFGSFLLVVIPMVTISCVSGYLLRPRIGTGG